MKNITMNYRSIGTLLNVLLLALTMGFSITTPANEDSLYISDGGDDTVKQFNAKTGKYLGNFVTPGNGGLHGPRGLIFIGDKLDVVNQNVGTPFNGEILQYRQNNGDFFAPLVSNTDPKPPFAPRGLLRGPGNTVYVADFDFVSGAVKQFNSRTGQWIANLDTTGFTNSTRLFIPRSIVRGPDDLLYVSVIGDLSANDVLTGYVLRFNPQNGKFVDVFTSHLASCATNPSTHLHRPEGLVFGPDEKLYVTSFRADANDTDKVLILNGKTGKCLDEIDLDQVGGPRAFAQAILFGPNGRLFVPINNTGEVRRYNVKTKTFNVFVPSAASSGPLQQPWYLTFGETDPRTLEYDN